MFAIASAFIIYFFLLFLIGFFALKKSSASNDFAMGKRSVNYWVTAISVQASDMSGWLFMGYPALIYMGGLSKCWVAIGLSIGMFLTWQFIAKKIRIATEQYNSVTISSYFEERFNDTSGLIRIVSALFCLLFFTFYISAGFVELGRLFESIVSIPYHIGISIGVVVVFYTLLGGFVSMAWVDFFQGLFLLAVLMLVPFLAYLKIGGMQVIVLAAHNTHKNLDILPAWSLHSVKEIIFLAAEWGLGYFGLIHVLTKFMGIDDVSKMRRAQYIGMTWQAIALTCATLIGVIGIAYFPQGLARSELVFVAMVKDLFSPFIAGFILCAVIAAAINVIGAQVLSSASIIVEDFFKRIGSFSSRSLIYTSRLLVLGICLLAYASAWTTTETIFSLVRYAWAGLGCTFGPLLLVCLYTKMTNRYAALIGIIVGGCVGALWSYAAIPAMIAGYCASLLSMLLVAGVAKFITR